MREPQMTSHLQVSTPSLGPLVLLFIFATVLSSTGNAWGAAQAPDAVQAPDKDAEKLQNDQAAIAGRYSRFERLLSQMADMLGRDDPERAELLRRAISEGRENAIASELESINELLSKGDLGPARKKQTEVTKGMQQILTLLQSEDRRSEVEKERERLNQILNDVRNLTARQKADRAAAQNSRSPSNAAPGQQETLKKTGDVLDDVQSHDASQGDSENGDPTDGDPKDGDPKDKGSNDKKSGEPSEPGEPSESGEPGEPGEPSESGESGESQSGQQQQQQTPGREQLEKAKKEMQDAIDKLKDQDRDGALDNQDEAIKQLEKAQKELEETLKQLREEEKEMILAALEARFQRMLSLQTQIHDETVALGATAREKWLNTAIGRCRELSQQQADLTRECSLTVGLLQEDGTSVSILIAVEDIESDMKTVASRLQDTKAFDLTQSIQTDIIEALRELIETVQQEMEDMEQQQQQQQQQEQQPPSQQQAPLVELMAEIKVLRSLQLRVNRRTATVDRLLQAGDPTEQAALVDQLEELAIRQNRLTESAGVLAQQMERN